MNQGKQGLMRAQVWTHLATVLFTDFDDALDQYPGEQKIRQHNRWPMVCAAVVGNAGRQIRRGQRDKTMVNVWMSGTCAERLAYRGHVTNGFGVQAASPDQEDFSAFDAMQSRSAGLK